MCTMIPIYSVQDHNHVYCQMAFRKIPKEWSVSLMRKRKPYQVLTFYTTSAAMAMEAYCQEKNIGGRLIPTPRELSAGCGLTWRMEPDEYARCKEELLHAGIEIEQNTELII